MLAQQLVSTPVMAPTFTIWYYVQVAGDELITFKLQLEEKFLGLGHLQQIRAEVNSRYPGHTVLDWWRCKPPVKE